MRSWIPTIVYLLSILHSTYASDSPVCIVGAGPAGLVAASRLEANGQPVVIFEKQTSVGGKCQAYYDNDGIYHPLGALLFTNETYRDTLDIIQQTGVPATLFTAGRPVYEYSLNGTITLSPAITTEFEAELLKESLIYAGIWISYFNILNSTGYKNGVPPELTVTSSQWLASHNFSALSVIFKEASIAYGYGDPSRTPILYMLQYLRPDVLAAFIGIGKSYLIDYHKVFVQFAQSFIKSSINLGVNITNIDRSGPGPVISYQGSNATSEHTQNCTSLILAFPPNIPALQAANLDISEQEQDVLGPVGMTNYYAGAVSMNATDREKLYEAASPAPNLPPPALGEPVAFLQLWNSSDVATTWSWDAYRQPSNITKARALLQSTLSLVNKDPADPNAVPIPITDGDIKGFVKADYFPHYDSAQLAAGYYDKLDQLQGQQNTYYASGLNAFEEVEFAVRAGYDVVDSYILNHSA